MVPQGRTPQGLGADDHSAGWAAGALIAAQMMVSDSPGSHPVDAGRVMVLLNVLTEMNVILQAIQGK